jgi:hypothetical protein
MGDGMGGGVGALRGWVIVAPLFAEGPAPISCERWVLIRDIESLAAFGLACCTCARAGAAVRARDRERVARAVNGRMGGLAVSDIEMSDGSSGGRRRGSGLDAVRDLVQ